MADQKKGFEAWSCVLGLVTILLLVMTLGCVGGYHSDFNHTIKIIESEDGEVIECINIYKQPAFDHPLINDLQTKSGSYSDDRQLPPGLVQSWHQYGECPKGTIPIRRTSSPDVSQTPFPFDRTQFNGSLWVLPRGREYAQLAQREGVYHGARAAINVWNPITEATDFSDSYIAAVSADPNVLPNIDIIEAGWTVHPRIYGDSRTRFFTYWSRDAGQVTGCNDHRCPGFVQTNQRFALGSPISAVSTYNGKLFEISVSVKRDKNTGNWWLQVQGVDMGYWPASIFTGLGKRATMLAWGGEIINKKPPGQHTTTQMGSGHFSGEGYGKASYFRSLKMVDESETEREPDNLLPLVSDHACYDLHVQTNWKTPFGVHFYYGGLDSRQIVTDFVLNQIK